MTTTRRFGLTRENLTLRDVDLVDTVMSAYEVHKHQGGLKLVDPALPPTLALDTTTGALAAGTTFFYRESWVDQFGLESAAGQEVSVTTPPPVGVPNSPTVTAFTGGTLAAGPTYYALSAVVGTEETSLSAPALISISDFRTAHVKAAVDTLPTSVDSFNVWRQGPRDGGFTKIGSITDPSIAFADDGSIPADPCACDPGNLPPAVNLTNATSKVTVTTSDPTFVGNATAFAVVKAWRLYRTTQSGVYGNNSLLAEVNTTVNADGTGGLLTSFVDDGSIPLAAGIPPEYSRTLQPSERIQNIIVATFGALPPAILYPDGVPAIVTNTRTFYVTSAGAWLQIDAPPVVVPNFVQLPATTGYLAGQEAIVRDTNELYVLLPAPSPATGLSWQRVGGGPPTLDNPVLMDPDHIPWSVDVDLDGHVITRAVVSIGTPYPLGRGPVFESAAGNFFRLGVEEGGGLLFYTATVDPVDTVYPDGKGPTFQATTLSAYRLGVDDDGMMTLIDLPYIYAHTDAPVLVSPNGTHFRLVYDDPTVAYPTTEPVV